EPFFQDLHDLETARREEPVYILHLGDSHTAGGWFSGRLRLRFQQRFGSSGRGMMPPGEPFPWYFPFQVKVWQSPGWEVANSFRVRTPGLFGVTGFRTASARAGAVMRLECEEAQGFDLAEVEVAAGPEGGTLRISVDGRLVREVSTRSETVRARRISLETQPGSRRLELTPAGDGPVELLAWTIQRRGPGLVYDSHGIVGATINIIGRWSPEVVRWELEHRPPSLIVLEYGGNEGFHDDLETEAYAKAFRMRLAFLKKAAPKASFLIIGPADGARLPGYCLATVEEIDPALAADQDRPSTEARKALRAGKGQAKDAVFDCLPLTREEIESYDRLLGAEDPVLCRWHQPPKLGVVREVQRAVAQAEGYPFWDWSTLMPGECGIHAWTEADPPLAAKDHVHLQKKGYVLSADTLFDLLMEYYDMYRRAARGK
ncbi:MAG: hypothetical protein AB1896_17300, partial [Thermodesulfobacteriota bacterium]